MCGLYMTQTPCMDSNSTIAPMPVHIFSVVLPSFHKEVKRRLNSGSDYYHSVQTESFASCFLSQNLKIKINRTIMLPVLLYGYETWSNTLMKDQTGSLRTGH
jgi:hypothetical protein